MKRTAMILVVALVVGGVVASLMARDAGYVLVVYDGASLETSLWFALLTMLLTYVGAKIVVAIVRRISQTGSALRSSRESRRLRQAHEQTLRGVLLLAEADWNAARAALLGSVAHGELPLINYLGAARAAAALGEHGACESLLQHAVDSTPGASIGVRLIEASMKTAMGRHAEARTVLEALHRDAPRHAEVLKQLCAVCRELGDWRALIELGAELRKHKTIGEDEASALLRAAWIGRSAQVDVHELTPLWESVPKRAREDGELVASFARAMIRTGAVDGAEEMLRKALQQRWDVDLIEIYGRITGASPERRLASAESWLPAHRDDAALLLALGRLALSARQFAKAREHFEASSMRKPSPVVYGELGRLCTSLGETERAVEFFSRGVADGLPALPLPERSERPR